MPPVLRLLRPRQWIKNGFVVAPIIFAHQFTSSAAWMLTLLITLAFAMAASGIYIFNDMVDRREDQFHPIKRTRPIAAGEVTIPTALVIMLVCFSTSAALLWQLPAACSEVIAGYIALNVIYTLYLKRKALLDVFFIAICFVLRVLAGCFALSVMVSPWILITTFMLALFIGCSKRYHELSIPGYLAHKQNLQSYSREFLDKLVVMSGTAALVCYAIYTTEIARVTGDVNIVYTVMFVAFGLFRYLQSIYVLGQGGEPESVVLRDPWQWATIILWLLTTLYSF